MHSNAMNPKLLIRNSFVWSQARLIIAAVALFLGGVPPIVLVLSSPALSGLSTALLKLAWVISGVASAYLCYQWHTAHYRLFGGSEKKDRTAFLVSVISGLNLGIVGLFGKNIGMSIASGRIIFFITGILYLWAFYHLQQRWKQTHGQLF